MYFQDSSRARAGGLPRVLPSGSALAQAGCTRALLLMLLLASAGASAPLGAQRTESQPRDVVTGAALDSLIHLAVSANPQLKASRARIEAAEVSVGPAALRPDPMLMAGIQNLPVSSPDFRDGMTMKMVGISQTIPAPGRLAAAQRLAEQELEVARAGAAADSLRLVREVKVAYYDIAYLDQALAIVSRTRDVLVELIAATEARLQVGTGGQGDVLRARLEAARLGEQASLLLEERRGAVARLNAALDQPSELAVTRIVVPVAVAAAAVAVPSAGTGFVASTLGSRAAGSPLPPLPVLQELAERRSPVLRAERALIAAGTHRAELVRLERRPDVDVSLQYGQRDGMADVVSAVVSLPLPLRRARKQDALANAARLEVAALQWELAQRRNALHADVARLHAQLERARTQLALTVRAILPQSRAALESAISAFQAGRTDFSAVLETQATLFETEVRYHQALTDFARTLAELELVVGSEVLP